VLFTYRLGFLSDHRLAGRQGIFFDNDGQKFFIFVLFIWQQYPIKDGLQKKKCKAIMKRGPETLR